MGWVVLANAGFNAVTVREFRAAIGPRRLYKDLTAPNGKSLIAR